MKRKPIRLLCTALCAAALIGVLPVPAAAAGGDYIAAAHTKNNGSPYYIMVNRAADTVTVYTLGPGGYYTVPFKAMICSTGRSPHATPLGTYTVTRSKKPWCYMIDGTYAQYSTQFNGQVLFHSVCYRKKDPSTLITEEYNLLGSKASLGCVRLQVEDAKWIYDNCPPGTKVTVYDGKTAGALGKPQTRIPKITAELANGWEPTDPRAENPWQEMLPFSDVLPGAWYYSAVRYVCERGMMQGTGRASFEPDIPLSRAMALQIVYNIVNGGAKKAEKGQPWYASALDWAAANGLTDGLSVDAAALDGPIPREEFTLVLYRADALLRAHPSPDPAALEPYRDAGQISPFAREAMLWAVDQGILQGTPAGKLLPGSPTSRAEMAAILSRYAPPETAG